MRNIQILNQNSQNKANFTLNTLNTQKQASFLNSTQPCEFDELNDTSKAQSNDFKLTPSQNTVANQKTVATSRENLHGLLSQTSRSRLRNNLGFGEGASSQENNAEINVFGKQELMNSSVDVS